MSRLLAVLALAALTAACTDRATAPEQQRTPAVSSNFMNNPDNGNWKIYRFEDAYAVCWTEEGGSLRACHSTIPLSGGTEPDCGPQGVLDPVAQQWNYVTGRDAVHGIADGPVWITVRDLSQSGVCFNALLVAQGTGTIHNTDNSVFGTGPDNPSTNSWGWMVQGAVTTPSGTTMQYSAHYRAQYSNNKGLREIVSDINLH